MEQPCQPEPAIAPDFDECFLREVFEEMVVIASSQIKAVLEMLHKIVGGGVTESGGQSRTGGQNAFVHVHEQAMR